MSSKTKPVRSAGEAVYMRSNAAMEDLESHEGQSVTAPADVLIPCPALRDRPTAGGFGAHLLVAMKGADHNSDAADFYYTGPARGGVATRPENRGAIVRYECPGCALRMWGRPGLFIICRDCDVPLEENSGRAVHSMQPPLPLFLPFHTRGDRSC